MNPTKHGVSAKFDLVLGPLLAENKGPSGDQLLRVVSRAGELNDFVNIRKVGHLTRDQRTVSADAIWKASHDSAVEDKC